MHMKSFGRRTALIIDANGGDSSLSAQSCGHTMKTKVEYYQGEVDWESVHKSHRAHHPAFVEGW